MELNDKYAHLNEMTLAELVEEVGDLGGGDDWEGCFTHAGQREFDYAKELLKSRIAELEAKVVLLMGETERAKEE